MAAVNLPDNPSDGDTQDVGGITYTYNSSKGYWTAAASGGGGGGGASVTTDDSAPSSPSDGDLWYDTDDGGMFVYYADTDSSQWVEVIGSQGADGADGATGPAGADGSAAVYATVDDLPETASAGDQAFVTASNRLYLWNGSGWYNIALINTTPSISGAASSYALALDGTATTVTITATDPEGLPITYSIASDTSGNIATVTQSSNVFTITPSTSDANAGTFSLTFRASDGVNIATAVSEFTLQFSVHNQKYTSALITATDNGYVSNKIFRDSSGNNHSITVTGDAAQNTFSPYRHAGYSTHLTTNTSYVRSPTSADFDIGGTGDWAYEAWVYVPSSHSFATYARAFGLGPNYNNSKAFGLQLSDGANSNYITVYWDDASGLGRKLISSTTFDKGQWNHLLVARSGNSIGLFYNGTRIASNDSYTNAIDTGNTYLFAGHTGNGTEGAEQYIKSLRFINGSHPYDASASSITTPSSDLEAVTNTKFLLGQKPYLVDESSNSHALTTSGTVRTKPVAPYDTQEYSAAAHGGSVYLDGTGDRLTVGATSDLGFGTGDFTIEYWIKHESKLSGSNYPYAFDMRSQDNEAKLAQYPRSSAYNIVGIYVSQNTIVSGTNQMYDGMDWVHYAVCKTGGYLKGYFNGKQDFSVADSTDYGSSGQISIGSTYSNLYHMQGHIADFRVVKGTAVYTGEFTPPTAPLTAITNTSLLLPFDDSTIIDKSQSVPILMLRENTTISSTQTKHLNYSMYLDGTGDCIILHAMNQIFDGDFTVEGWYNFSTYTPSNANSRLFCSKAGNINAADNLQIIVARAGDIGSGGAGTLAVYTNGYQIQGSTVQVADNTWHHVAVTREGTNLKLFVDGTQTGSTKVTSQSFTFDSPRLGARDATTDTSSKYTGYMSDIRFTKGLARYTANFTPPTAALQG